MIVTALLLSLALQQNVPPPPPIRVQDPAYNQALAQRGLQTPPTPPEPGIVEGIVVEMPSERPVAGATVRLQGQGGANNAAILLTNSKSDGSFAFRNVPPGTYVLEAELGGYIRDNWTNENVPPNVTGMITPRVQLTPGQHITTARLQLVRGAVITGRLSDDRGDPVIGAAVQVLKTTFSNGLRTRTPLQTVFSNDLGEYRFFSLKPGQYFLSVGSSENAGVLPNSTAKVLPLYYPGTIDSQQAQAIDVVLGETRSGVNFSSIPTRTARVSGNVQGTALAAGIILSPVNGTTSVERTANEKDGSFEFTGVMPGPYMLVARTIEQQAAIPIDVRNDTLGMRIFLGSGFRIPVKVHIDGHGPEDDPELDTLYFNVRGEPAIQGIETEVYSPFPDGHFTLDLLARDYKLELNRPPGYYIKSMTLGGSDILRQGGLHVSGSSDAPLEILVAKDTGSVQGTTGGKVATVVLVPDAARRNQRTLYQSVKIGGSFHFEKVPPGDYKLFAWTEENGGPWLEPDYLRKYEDQGIPVHVESGKIATATATIPVF
jgi:hypothetical protein